MNNREKMIETTIRLIEEKGEGLSEITVREICARAGVGLGLVNYCFGSKEGLIEVCVERIINGIVEKFTEIRESANNFTPFERLHKLGCLTLDYLFEHAAVSRISMLSDLKKPKSDDNSMRTYRAYLPLVSACRPEWSEEEVKNRTFMLISIMQSAFLRREIILAETGEDLCVKETRHAYHLKQLKTILGGKDENYGD